MIRKKRWENNSHQSRRWALFLVIIGRCNCFQLCSVLQHNALRLRPSSFPVADQSSRLVRSNDVLSLSHLTNRVVKVNTRECRDSRLDMGRKVVEAEAETKNESASIDNTIASMSSTQKDSGQSEVDTVGLSVTLSDVGESVGLMEWVQEKIFFGIQPSPEILAICSIYFVEGALGLARLAQTFYLKDTLHLGPAEMSALTGIFTLPWTIKPLYGFLSDGVPLFGYRRRSYLILAGMLGCLSFWALSADFWGILGSMDASLVTADSDLFRGTIAAFLLSSACIAFSDVVADGIVVQRTRDSDDPKVAGGLQSLCWGSAAIGSLLSAYFSGSLLEIMGPQQVFAITAVLPAVVALIAFAIDEKPISNVHDNTTQPTTNLQKSNVEGVKDQIIALKEAIQLPNVWKPAFFLFLWQSTPTSEGAFLYFMTDDLGMGPEFLGRVRLVTAAASLLGVWLYQKFLRTVTIKNILKWTSILSAPLGLSQLLLISHINRDLGIPDGAFVFGDDVVLAILGELAFLPILVLAARICPPGVEAVLFATLMSIFNGASTVGTEIGAALTKYLGVTETNFENLGLLTFICSISSLYPLVFLGLLDEVGDQSEAEIEETQLL